MMCCVSTEQCHCMKENLVMLIPHIVLDQLCSAQLSYSRKTHYRKHDPAWFPQQQERQELALIFLVCMHPLSMMGSNYHSMDLCLSPLLPGHCHFLSLLRQAMRLFLVWDSEGISEVTDTIVEDLFSAADTDDSSDDDDNGGGEGGGGHGRGRAVAKTVPGTDNGSGTSTGTPIIIIDI